MGSNAVSNLGSFGFDFEFLYKLKKIKTTPQVPNIQHII